MNMRLLRVVAARVGHSLKEDATRVIDSVVARLAPQIGLMIHCIYGDRSVEGTTERVTLRDTPADMLHKRNQLAYSRTKTNKRP